MFEIEILIVISMILSGTPANALFACPNISNGDLAFVCPNAVEISPCICQIAPEAVSCNNERITQDVLNRVVASVRSKNNQKLEMNQFHITSTNLVELDLTPFEGGIFSSLYFQKNSLLSSIIGPQLNSTNWNPIQVGHLILSYNNFQEEGLQTVLSYFNKTEITEFYLYWNRLRGSLGPEFLPGYSDLSNMEAISLSNNNIRVLGGGQCRGISWATQIDLKSNGLEEIGEDAFVIDESTNPVNYLFITLRNNSLSAESFHPNSGIANTGRGRTDIYLQENQFRTVKEDRFLDFLEARPSNTLNFNSNPIWCDPDMKWLKDRRREFESRVTGLNCINDPGHTAFTSCFVDGDCSGITEETTTEYTTTTVTTTTTTTTTDTTTPDITTTTQTTTTGGPQPDCPPYGPSNPPIFYPGISCDTYYMCTEQGPILLNCPRPLLWDQNRKRCAYPSEVDCEMKLAL